MSDTDARLFLLTPPIDDAAAFRPVLAAACGSGQIAAVMVRLSGRDERGLVNALKALAPAAQETGAAAILAVPGIADPEALAVRGGADGVHALVPGEWRALRGRLKHGLSLGAGGLRTRDDAMGAGEAGADYVMFGEPRPDGWTPPLDDVVERAEWWASIFETPCVAFAPRLADVPALAATGAEFVALGDAVWAHPEGPAAAVATALALLLQREPAV